MAVYETGSRAETAALGERLAKVLRSGSLVLFTGGLGAGKTAFCEGIARGLGCTDEVSSPTFAIVNVYRGPQPFAHFDMYRISTMEDLQATGFFDYLDDGAVVAAEWSENVAPLVAGEPAVHVDIAVLDEHRRRITIEGALDSAGKTAGIAILRDSRLIYECYLATGHTHSETLLCLCKNAFDAAGLSPAEIDVFAAAAGPGSFTGLRIGLAAVKGLAFPHDTPCAAVSTLEALAYSAAVEGTLLCALDARRGEVYWAGFFAADGAVERLCPDESAPAASLRGFVESAREPVWLLGDGAQLVDEALNGTGKTRLYPEAYRLGRAGGVCRAALAAGETVPAAQLIPDYHRLSQAERERAARLQAAP